MVEVRGVSDGVMAVVVFEEDLWVCSAKWNKF